MTHAWWGTGTTVTPNLPAWSISCEWFAYLLFPLLCLLITRLRAAPLLFIVAGLGLATVWTDVTDHPLIRVMAGFLVGMAVFQLSRRTSPVLGRMPVLGTLVVVLIVLWATLSKTPRLEVGILLFAALILVLASERDWLCRVLSLRVVVYLGEVSYAVYMVHWVVRVVVRTAAEKTGLIDAVPAPVMVLAYIIVTIAAAIGLYHVVERPWRKRLRRLLDPRSQTR
jgi:peptidoglycan/LPS O-acetylase OafA/YrhL